MSGKKVAVNLGSFYGFARNLGISEEVALEIYESAYQRLCTGATISSYVSVIAEKQAKDSLRNRARCGSVVEERPRKATGFHEEIAVKMRHAVNH